MATLVAAGAVAIGALLAGCGPESHPNDPRPPLPVEVTVNVTNHAVQVAPESVAVKGGGAPLSQNAGVKEPEANPDQPLVVVFTVSNTTETDTALEIRGSGGFDKRSGPIVAHGNTTYKLGLQTDDYRLSAADIPAAKPAPFTVGPERVSSQNDLLLP
jgi:hypothetical protein